jgi:glutaconate CoA-transferase subunit A
VTAEEITDRLDLSHPETAKNNLFERGYVTGVVAAPLGAHPTSSHDLYGFDVAHLRVYAASAAEPDGFARYVETFIGASEQDYIDRVGGAAAVRALPLPVF